MAMTLWRRAGLVCQVGRVLIGSMTVSGCLPQRLNRVREHLEAHGRARALTPAHTKQGVVRGCTEGDEA